MSRIRWAGPALLALGCSVTPITGKIVPGDDPFVIVVGEGPDGATDLFAAPAPNGRFVRLTFTRQVEELPKLAPDGRRVGFLRRYDGGVVELVVLDLETMGEVRAPLPLEILRPTRLGWSPAGDTLIIADSVALFVAALGMSPVAVRPVGPAGIARADSLSWERLGDPVFASIRPCRAAAGFCAVTDSTETALGGRVVDPVRWGPNAVGYLRDGRVEVRPLAGGPPSHPDWSEAPTALRQPTYHAGTSR